METTNVIKGTMIATAVAGLFACASNTPKAETPSGTASVAVKCQGVNPCRGKGECSGAGHQCGKHTPCKGQGWLTVANADECLGLGGTVL